MRKLVDQIETILLDYSSAKQLETEYYPGCCPTWEDDVVKMLNHYKEALVRFEMQCRWGATPCLNDRQLTRLMGKAQYLAGLRACRVAFPQEDPVFDPMWIAEHPHCVSKPKWERYIHQVCDLTYDISFVHDVCEDITYSVSVVELIDNLLKACKKTYTLTNIDVKQCKIEWDIYRKVSNCSVSFESYQEITRCGVSYKLLADLAACNVCLDYNYTNQCPEIRVDTQTYSACDIPQISVNLV